MLPVCGLVPPDAFAKGHLSMISDNSSTKHDPLKTQSQVPLEVRIKG